jgi:hypothetical protein
LPCPPWMMRHRRWSCGKASAHSWWPWGEGEGSGARRRRRRGRWQVGPWAKRGEHTRTAWSVRGDRPLRALFGRSSLAPARYLRAVSLGWIHSWASPGFFWTWKATRRFAWPSLFDVASCGLDQSVACKVYGCGPI